VKYLKKSEKYKNVKKIAKLNFSAIQDESSVMFNYDFIINKV